MSSFVLRHSARFGNRSKSQALIRHLYLSHKGFDFSGSASTPAPFVGLLKATLDWMTGVVRFLELSRWQEWQRSPF